jgi:hypothetical protein
MIGSSFAVESLNFAIMLSSDVPVRVGPEVVRSFLARAR